MSLLRSWISPSLRVAPCLRTYGCSLASPRVGNVSTMRRHNSNDTDRLQTVRATAVLMPDLLDVSENDPQHIRCRIIHEIEGISDEDCRFGKVKSHSNNPRGHGKALCVQG